MQIVDFGIATDSADCQKAEPSMTLASQTCGRDYAHPLRSVASQEVSRAIEAVPLIVKVPLKAKAVHCTSNCQTLCNLGITSLSVLYKGLPIESFRCGRDCAQS